MKARLITCLFLCLWGQTGFTQVDSISLKPDTSVITFNTPLSFGYRFIGAFSYASGNVDLYNVLLRSTFLVQKDRWEARLRGGFRYGQINFERIDEVSYDEYYNVQADGLYFMNRGWLLWTRGRFISNQLRKVDARFQINAGLGYEFLKQSTHRTVILAGAGYEYAEFDLRGITDLFPGIQRFSDRNRTDNPRDMLRLYTAISGYNFFKDERLGIAYSFAYQPALDYADDYLVEGQVNLFVPIVKKLQLLVGVQYSYESVVVRNRSQKDLLVLAGFLWTGALRKQATTNFPLYFSL